MAQGTARGRGSRRIVVTPPGHTAGMGEQMVLIEERGADYRLDEHTREIGRRGVAAAREALRKAAEQAAKQAAQKSRAA